MITHFLRLALAHTLAPFTFNRWEPGELDLQVENLGIYVHIPFCASFCSFCPYHKDLYAPEPAAQFAQALLKEIDLVSASSPGVRPKVGTVYFGGGSPALLLEYLPGIVEKLKSRFEITGNLGLELHPRDIGSETLQQLKTIGFNMVSVGVQSFSPGSTQALGRPSLDSAAKLRLVKAAGFQAVDVDLLFGYAGQTAAALLADFRQAVENGATQVSTYPFIEFSYAKKSIKPLDRANKKIMLEQLLRLSRELGFERTSIWTFAKQDTPKYSSVTRDNFIGFGPSATTLLSDIFKINTFSLPEYLRMIDAGQVPGALALKFTPRTRALYWLFWSAYNLNIDEENFRLLFNTGLKARFGPELFIAQALGFIEPHGRGYRLTEKGACAFHLIEQKYTNQYIDKTWRILKTQPWPKNIKLY